MSFTVGRDTNELAAELDKFKGLMMDLKLVETIKFRRHEEILDDIKRRRVEKIGVWKEVCAENADSLINNVKVAKANRSKMSVEMNFIFARFKEHVRAVHCRARFHTFHISHFTLALTNAWQALVNANVKRKVRLKEAMAMVRELLENGRSISWSDYSV